MNKYTRNSILAACLTFVISLVNAQAPGSFNYQAVARNIDGSVLANKVITIRASIAEDSTMAASSLYAELDTVTTTAQGYFNIHMGMGTPVAHTFSNVNWALNKPRWLRIQIDPTGHNHYTVVGVSQLLSVPYALFAASSGASVPLKATAPLNIASNTIKINPGTNTGDLLSWDGNNWVARAKLPDTSITTYNVQPYLALNWCIALQGIFPSRNGAEPFLGELELFGFNFAPQGWAQCNGQLLAISQNTALFSLLGTQYGGNGISTFALPDLRSRVPIHSGQGPGLSNYDQGQVGGTEYNTIIIHR